MGRKIFVSYKHEDDDVEPLSGTGRGTNVRDYVNKLEEKFAKDDNIFKGEKDDEDLSEFKDETIRSHLRDSIFDSTVTIVLISKNMQDEGEMERDQWIPWEISYSLKVIERKDGRSKTNAMLAVVLPDREGEYDYVVTVDKCHSCGTTNSWNTGILFPILRDNMFNRKKPNKKTCTQTTCGGYNLDGHSYIRPVRWDSFIGNVDGYVENAVAIKEEMASFDITKETSDEVS